MQEAIKTESSPFLVPILAGHARPWSKSMKATVQGLLGAFAIATVLSATAEAGPLEDGIDAYHEKAYAKAAELWRPLAEAGNAPAQYLLGSLYVEGNGVERDDATAFMWFLRAANQGDAAAQYNVGASYSGGKGAPQSYVDAAKWFRRAADQGVVFAQLNLGLLYAAGNGVSQDSVEALKWLELAFFGLPAGEARSDVARAMTDVTAKMTREQIGEAQQRERAWKARPEGK
jgi:TPR repeat protein